MDSEDLAKAARLAQGGDPQAARPLVARALAADADDADALTLLGLIAQRSGDENAALDAFARACVVDANNPARWNNRAVALKQAGRFADAIAAFERSLTLRPGDAGTLTNLGSCLIAAGREPEAEPPLRAAVRAQPDRAEAWNNLGVALTGTGRKNEATVAYRRALGLRPAYVEAALNLADALGDAPEAGAIAGKVLRDLPGHPRATNILASAHDRQGDFDAAIALYRAALAVAPHPAIGMNLTLSLLRAGRPHQALALTQELLRETPSVTTPLALQCVALHRIGAHDALTGLMQLDAFVTVVDADADADFHAALESELRAHPSLTYEPAGLVTRGGRQSDDLATTRTPAIGRLTALATEALARRHAELADQRDHPWLAARPGDWSLTMWGTILQPGGAVEPHIHAPNWLSGVYYPALPASVRGAEDGGFAIGAFPDTLGGGGAVSQYAARPGRMILFPSFLWHKTLPFAGPDERISFAFDLVPAGTGRPHRLRR